MWHYWRDENKTQNVQAGKFKETNVKDPGIDGGIAGEWILKKQCVEVQTALMCFKILTSEEHINVLQDSNQ